MAFDIQAFSLGTAPTLIAHATFNPMRVLIHTHEHSSNNDIYIGGADVTISNGYRLDKLEALNLIVTATDLLYGVSGKTGHVISWLTEPV